MTLTSKSQSIAHKTIILAFCLIITCSAYSKSTPSTVAFAEVSPDYHRKMLPTGRYEPETYAFGKGICHAKDGKDASLNALTFNEIGAILSEALTEADYIPTPSPEETDLVIVVSWGRTILPVREFGSETTTRLCDATNALFQNKVIGIMGNPKRQKSQAEASMADTYESQMEMMLTIQRMEDQARWESNSYNAKLLGYKQELLWASRLVKTSMTMRNQYSDLLVEIEQPRYFVILQAYDFQKMWKEKKKVLLWTTRFSIRAKGRKFDEELRNMALASSRVFGTESKKLRRGLTPAEVKLGELEYLEVVEED